MLALEGAVQRELEEHRKLKYHDWMIAYLTRVKVESFPTLHDHMQDQPVIKQTPEDHQRIMGYWKAEMQGKKPH